jgi:hypothetical protein
MDELLDTAQAARLLARPESTLVRWRFENRGPAYIRIGRGIRYRASDLEKYVSANRVEPGAPQASHGRGAS